MLLDLYYTSLTKKQRPTVLWAEVMSEMTCESPAQTRGDSGTSDGFDDGATPHGDVLLSPLSHPSQPLSALFFRGEQTSLRSPFTLWAACVRERGAAESKGAFLRIPKGANEQWMWGKCSRRCPADMQMRKLAQIVFLMLMPPNKGTVRTQRADEGYVPLGTEKFSVLSPDPPDTHEACHTPAAAQGCHATPRDWGATPLQASLSVHMFFKQAVLPL